MFSQRLVFFAAFAVKDFDAKLAKDAKKKGEPRHYSLPLDNLSC
jgi:hypothetical protein